MPDYKTLEEATAAQRKWFETTAMQSQHNFLGGVTDAEVLEQQKADYEEAGGVGNLPTMLKRSVRDTNAAVGIALEGMRNVQFNKDPDFNVEDHFDELTQGLPQEVWANFDEADSLAEAQQIRKEALRELETGRLLANGGAWGATSMLVAGAIDIDSLFMLFTGGTSKLAGFAAKAHKYGRLGKAAGKLGAKAAEGALAAGVVGGVESMARASGSLSHLPQTVLGGMAFNSLLPGGRRANESIAKLSDDVAFAFDHPDFGIDRNSVWRGESHAEPVFKSDNILDAAIEYMKGVTKAKTTAFAEKFQELLDKTPFASDYNKMLNSNSKIAQALGHMLLESPSGMHNRIRTAALDDEAFTKQILTYYQEPLVKAYRKWAEKRQLSMMDTHWHGQHRDMFYREVLQELERRRQKISADVDPNVKAAADAWEKGMDHAYSLAQRTGVEGFDKAARAGYHPLLWSGRKVMQAINTHGKKKVHNLLRDGYMRALETDKATASILAKAILRRSTSKAKSIDMRVSNLLNADGRRYLKQALEDSGVSAERAEVMVESLAGKTKEQGVSSRAKARTDIDLLTELDGLSMYDLIETDMMLLGQNYARDVSGRSALAMKGITNDLQKTDIINAILDEEAAAGKQTLSRDMLEGVFSYFEAGPIHGGVSPWVRRLKTATNLALLPQLGLTQMAELGVQIGAVGFDNFIAHNPLMQKVFRNARKGNTDTVLKEFEPFIGTIGNEHLLYRDDLMLDMARGDVALQSNLTRFLDSVLAKGQRMMGYTSGFYQIQRAQHRMTVAAMTDKIFRGVRDGTLTKERLADLGVDLNSVRRKIADGHVKFDEYGSVAELNLQDWKLSEAEDFVASINRNTYQVVQKVLAGESTAWFHNDFGAVLTHLQSFPLAAIQKQFLRGTRIADQDFFMMAMYGTCTAGLAYTAKQVVNGRTQNLDADHIIRGTLGLSSMSGWFGMAWDPAMGMLGLDEMKLSGYSRGTGANLLDFPARTTLSRMSALPGALLSPGEWTNEEVNALQTLPIIGRAYGVSLLTNALRD